MQSINSSPSLYSHYHDTRRVKPGREREWDDTSSRISMVSGPRVTKYADIPWDEIEAGGALTRILRAATGRSDADKGLSVFSEGSLGSSVSIASSQTSDAPATPHRKLQPSALPIHLTPGHPQLSSGSPGFGLISLEAAQERERLKTWRQTPKADPIKAIKQKKSLMKMFKAATPVPKMPTPRATLGADLDHRLELRPISVNFSNALPSSYLSELAAGSPRGRVPSEEESFANAKKAWMVQVFELEAQIRELKDGAKGKRCEGCACTCGELLRPGGVMERGRAKTGGARGVFGSGSLYEWE